MRVSSGRDFQSAQMGGTAGASAQNLALTANATAPADADTSLSGEIATAGGGLLRKAAAYAHTPGASNYTLTATFTANGSDVFPVTVNKLGVFVGSTSTMVFESLLTPAGATLNASGDAVTVTETVSI